MNSATATATAAAMGWLNAGNVADDDAGWLLWGLATGKLSLEDFSAAMARTPIDSDAGWAAIALLMLT
jgi:hypothetical protein